MIKMRYDILVSVLGYYDWRSPDTRRGGYRRQDAVGWKETLLWELKGIAYDIFRPHLSSCPVNSFECNTCVPTRDASSVWVMKVLFTICSLKTTFV